MTWFSAINLLDWLLEWVSEWVPGIVFCSDSNTISTRRSSRAAAAAAPSETSSRRHRDSVISTLRLLTSLLTYQSSRHQHQHATEAGDWTSQVAQGCRRRTEYRRRWPAAARHVGCLRTTGHTHQSHRDDGLWRRRNVGRVQVSSQCPRGVL